MPAHTGNPSTQEAKARGLRVQGQKGQKTQSQKPNPKQKPQHPRNMAKEVVPIVKCLLHKHEDLSSGPRTSLVVYDCSPSQGDGDWRSLNSGASSLLYSKPEVRKMGSTRGINQGYLLAFTYMGTCLHTHKHTKILAQKLTLKCQVPKG